MFSCVSAGRVIHKKNEFSLRIIDSLMYLVFFAKVKGAFFMGTAGAFENILQFNSIMKMFFFSPTWFHKIEVAGDEREVEYF